MGTVCRAATGGQERGPASCQAHGPAGSSSTGVTWGTAGSERRLCPDCSKMRAKASGAPHLVKAEPLATGWDRHRGPDQKETAGRPRPGKRGAGSKEQRAWGFDYFFFKAAPQYGTQATSSYWQKKAGVKSTDFGRRNIR